MSRKLAIIAVTGIAASVVLIGSAAVIDGPRIAAMNWKRFDMTWDTCTSVPGTTATRRELDWDGDDEVRLGLPGKAHYRRGEGSRLVMTGDPAVIAHVRVRDGRIRLDCGLTDADDLDITLPGREFRRFDISGAGSLDAAGLDQDSVELHISGAGNIRASGKVRDVKVRISGAGQAHLGALAAQDMDMAVSGAGGGEVAPRERAKLNVSGAGTITLLTNPQSLDTRVSGVGRIVHKPQGAGANDI